MEKLKFDNDIYSTIRKNIRKYRKEKGMTSEELSQLVDLSHDYVRHCNAKVAKVSLWIPFIEFLLLLV